MQLGELVLGRGIERAVIDEPHFETGVIREHPRQVVVEQTQREYAEGSVLRRQLGHGADDGAVRTGRHRHEAVALLDGDRIELLPRQLRSAGRNQRGAVEYRAGIELRGFAEAAQELPEAIA
jgi:hypothetical protein